MVTNSAGDMRDAAEELPRAMFPALGIVVVVYVVVSTIVVMTLNPRRDRRCPTRAYHPRQGTAPATRCKHSREIVRPPARSWSVPSNASRQPCRESAAAAIVPKSDLQTGPEHPTIQAPLLSE